MQEKKQGVKRLLSAIQRVDESQIWALATVLNYHEPQLREDIDAISLVAVVDKEELGYTRV